jgi:hypothetical protein
LKERCDKDMDQRPGFLLAAKRLQELKFSAPAGSKKEETEARLQLIKNLLEEARTLANGKRSAEFQQAILNCANIMDLYQDYPDVKELVEQARQLREQLIQLAEQKR